jgi:transposase-like protein|tara:strand:- start:56 stop:307 length:252 start_codon:yes stop_codon:yes gene_type:complete
VFCPQCRSQEIINRDITPIYECSDCGYMFNEENFTFYEENVINIPDKKKTFSLSKLFFDKNDFISSIILILIVIFPFILSLLM